MKFRIVETDSFGRDYPNESFLPIPPLEEEDAKKIAEIINSATDFNHPRYWMVVPLDYKLDNSTPG